jgi:hypothetical protein
VLRSRVRAPGRASTIRNMPDVAKTDCAHSRPIPIRDQCQLQVGWARLARAVHLPPPHRFTSRGRSRGVGATCTAPTTHGRPKRTSAPECCQIGAGRALRIRLSVRTATLASQRPVARGFASRSTDWAARVQAYTSTLEVRAKRRELGGPADRQAPIFRQESEESECGIRRRMRRQPGGESGRRWCLGMEPSVRAAGTAAEAAERRLGATPIGNSWPGRTRPGWIGKPALYPCKGLKELRPQTSDLRPQANAK